MRTTSRWQEGSLGSPIGWVGGVFVMLALLLSACRETGWAAPAPGAGAGRPMTARELDVAEAAFRHMFVHNASGQGQTAAVYCLALQGASPDRHGPARDTDPPPALLRRLADVRPPVQPLSQCGHGEGFVLRDKSGQPGLEFYLASIDCQSDVRCVVRGGYYEASLSASGNTLTLAPAPRGRGWVVTSDKMDWIS